MVLKRVVFYFYKHPRNLAQPQGENLSEEVTEATVENPLNLDLDVENPLNLDLDSIFSEVSQALDEAVEIVEVLAEEIDREIQAILDDLIKRREFPGIEHSWREVTIHLPKISGGGWSNNQSYGYRGEDLEGEGFDLVITPIKSPLTRRIMERWVKLVLLTSAFPRKSL